MKFELWRILLKTNEYFVINKFTKSRKKTRRDSELQDAMNDLQFLTNRNIKLYKNICFDDKINEWQNDVRYNHH